MNEKILALLRDLPLSLEAEYDSGGVMLSVKEFPEAFDYAEDYEQALAKLVKSLKEWGNALSGEIDKWRKGREHEVVYLLKILASSESELMQCLRVNANK